MDIPESMEIKLDFSSSTYHKLTDKLRQIDTFRGSWQNIESHQGTYLQELRKIATVESIGSSTRIEGATLSDSEVEKLLRSVEVSKLEDRDEQEVVGYYEALQVILENYATIELTENYIHQLHSLLLQYSEKDQRHKGKYKRQTNKVVATYPDGKQRTIFNPTPVHLVDKEMRELVAWTKEQLADKRMHPVVVVAAFVYEFLSIHPYQDGNGRLSRLLTTLLLMQQGYDFIQYVSFEHVIETRKEQYYRALMAGQKKRGEKDECIDKWVLFFLDCLLILTERLEEKYEQYRKLKIDLNERQQQVMEYIKEQKTVQISDVNEALEDYSRNTLKKDLAYLTKEGLLIKTGAGRGTRYHFREE